MRRAGGGSAPCGEIGAYFHHVGEIVRAEAAGKCERGAAIHRPARDNCADAGRGVGVAGGEEVLGERLDAVAIGIGERGAGEGGRVARAGVAVERGAGAPACGGGGRGGVGEHEAVAVAVGGFGPGGEVVVVQRDERGVRGGREGERVAVVA